jgi:hypothetical protein
MTYEQQLNKALGIVFAVYRGVSLKREDGYWVCLGQRCQTLKDCDIVIDSAGNALANSLKTNKNVNQEKDNSQIS